MPSIPANLISLASTNSGTRRDLFDRVEDREECPLWVMNGLSALGQNATYARVQATSALNRTAPEPRQFFCRSPPQPSFLIKSIKLRCSPRIVPSPISFTVATKSEARCRAGGAATPICTALKNIECAQNLQVIMMCGQIGALLASASVANL